MTMILAEYLRRKKRLPVRTVAAVLRESPHAVLAFERRELVFPPRELQILAQFLDAGCAGERLLDEYDDAGRMVAMNSTNAGLCAVAQPADLDDDIDLDDCGDAEPTPAGARAGDTKSGVRQRTRVDEVKEDALELDAD